MRLYLEQNGKRWSFQLYSNSNQDGLVIDLTKTASSVHKNYALKPKIFEFKYTRNYN